MPGSDPISAWQGIYTVNGPNSKELQNSKYCTPNKVIASVNYYIPYKLGIMMGTTVSLFYSGNNYASGNVAGHSYIYDNDMNGDGVAADLIYIPNNRDEIKFVNLDIKDSKTKEIVKSYTADQQRDAFWAFVEQDEYLSKHKGEYAEAYSARAPWYNQIDLRIAEDFCFKTGKLDHKFQVSLDIQNLGNLINSHWGIPEINDCSKNGAILHYEGVDAGNVPCFTFNYDAKNELLKNSFMPNMSYSNCWKLQLGVKYFFN